MPQFMLLIHSDRKRWAELDEAEVGAINGEYFAVSEKMANAGVMRGGAPLHPEETASTASKGGVVTDGVYAESAEVVGGYYLLECEDQAAAVEWAKQLPGVERGLDRIEVREVFDLSQIEM